MPFAIESLRANAGFLSKCEISFAKGLNCIIGARGTCKSTIVEMLRFLFDVDKEEVKVLLGNVEKPQQPRKGLIAATLAAGTAQCAFADTRTNETFSVQRTIGGEPVVFLDGVQQVEAKHLLRNIEIYSQGDLARIAENPAQRLALIDRSIQAERFDLDTERRLALSQIGMLSEAIKRRSSEIDSRADAGTKLAAARSQLRDFESTRPELSDELAAERDRYLNRKRDFDSFARAVGTVAELPSASHLEVVAGGILQAIRTARLSGAPVSAEVLQQLAEVASSAHALATAVANLPPDATKSLTDGLRRYYSEQSQRYHDLRQAQDEATEALKREETARAEIEKLERIEREWEHLCEEQRRDMDARQKLRERAEACANKLYEMRLRQVEQINAEFPQVVLVLRQGESVDAHAQLVAQMLRGSNLRGQDDIARELVDELLPAELVDAVEGRSVDFLAQRLERDSQQILRLISHLRDNPLFSKIEQSVPEDVLEITLFVRGEARPLAQLSKGQMATALLPLILREGECPLVVDQPEDDLDNAYISSQLLALVEKLKSKRQIIFVTHNANVPVLGDAERVLVMEMTGPQEARVAAAGNVEEMKSEVIRLLEGGKEAFVRRQKRYGQALR